MSSYQNLSEADFAVMEIIWREGEIGSSVIIKELEKIFGWSRQTVRSYLVRLIDKGLVATRKGAIKRSYIYYSVVSREDYAAQEASVCLNKYFGSLTHMVAGLIQKESIEQEEIDELEKLIKRYRDKK